MIQNNEPTMDADSISTTNFGISTSNDKVDKKKVGKKAIIGSAFVFVLIATIGLSIGLSLGLKNRPTPTGSKSTTGSKNVVIPFDVETDSCEEEIRKLLVADGIDTNNLMKGMEEGAERALIRRERPARRRLIHQLTNSYLDGNGEDGALTHSAFLSNGYLLDRRRLSDRCHEMIGGSKDDGQNMIAGTTNPAVFNSKSAKDAKKSKTCKSSKSASMSYSSGKSMSYGSYSTSMSYSTKSAKRCTEGSMSMESMSMESMSMESMSMGSYWSPSTKTPKAPKGPKMTKLR